MGAGMNAAPKKGGAGKYIAIGCGALLLICCVTSVIYQVVCGGLAAMTASYPMPAPAPVTVPAPAPATAPATGGTAAGGVCQRATDCCNAYVTAMGAAAAGTNCGLYATMGGGPAEAGCQSAIDGFRAGLTAMSQTVPAACQ